MTDTNPAGRYRFGGFEVDAGSGELRRKGMRIRLGAQPFQMLLLLLERPGELLTREEIQRRMWPEGTFVDYEHGVNSAVNRIREALGDTANSPRFVETLARRGYRFVAPVERIGGPVAAISVQLPQNTVEGSEGGYGFLATPEELPKVPHRLAQTLFVLLQLMYLGFYAGALANLAEIEELLSALPHSAEIYLAILGTAAILIPVRAFLICAVLFRAPRIRENCFASGRFCSRWTSCGRLRRSCCCTTSTSDWRLAARRCWCTRRSRKGRWC
jgi:DNA-binding winged helix-turn-helix (wHTH) protein